jgi:hypothetical protein
VLVTVAGPAAADGSAGEQVRRLALRRALVGLAAHVGGLDDGEGALSGFGAPVPPFALERVRMQGGCALAAELARVGGAGVLYVSPNAVCFLHDGALLPSRLSPGVALSLYSARAAGGPLGVDCEFARPAPAQPDTQASLLSGSQRRAGVAVLQVAAVGLPVLVLSLGQYLNDALELDGGGLLCLRRPPAPIPLVVRDLLAASPCFVLGASGDRDELRRAVVCAPSAWTAQSARDWEERSLAERDRVTKGWRDVAAGAHPCLGPHASLQTLARALLGRALAKGGERLARWDVHQLPPAMVEYAAADAAATLLIGLRLQSQPHALLPCTCLVGAARGVCGAAVPAPLPPPLREAALHRLPPRARGRLLPAAAAALEQGDWRAGPWCGVLNSRNEPVCLDVDGWRYLAAEVGLDLEQALLTILDTGYVFLLDKAPARFAGRGNYSSVTESPLREKMGALMDDHLQRGITAAVEGSGQADEEFATVVHPLGSVPKKTPPGFRLVVDGTASGFNADLRTVGVSLPMINRILSLLPRGAALAECDGQEWFYQLYVDSSCHCMQGLRHAVSGALRRLRFLGMGFRPCTEVAQYVSTGFACIQVRYIAKRLSEKLGHPVHPDLRALDSNWGAAPPPSPYVGMAVWVDNFLTWTDKPALMQHVKAARDEACAIARVRLGNKDTGYELTTQELVFTGLVLRTWPRVELELPLEKCVKYLQLLRDLLEERSQWGSTSLASASKLAGVLEHVGQAQDYSARYAFQLARDAGAARAARQQRVVLQADTLSALEGFWLPLLSCGMPIVRSQWREGRNGIATATARLVCRLTGERVLAVASGAAEGMSLRLPPSAPLEASARGAAALELVLLSLDTLRGQHLLVLLQDADLVCALNDARRCRGGPRSQLWRHTGGVFAACMRRDIVLRAALEGEVAVPQRAPSVLVAHAFMLSERHLSAGGVRASVEVFGHALRHTALAAPGFKHLYDSGPPPLHVTAAALGGHVWCFPPFHSDIIEAALAYGCELLRADPRSVFTVVVPRWEERRWWHKLFASPVRAEGAGFRPIFTTLAEHPAGERVLQHLAGHRAVVAVGFPLVVARLSAAHSAALVRGRPAVVSAQAGA